MSLESESGLCRRDPGRQVRVHCDDGDKKVNRDNPDLLHDGIKFLTLRYGPDAERKSEGRLNIWYFLFLSLSLFLTLSFVQKQMCLDSLRDGVITMMSKAGALFDSPSKEVFPLL
ncbi:hypothetical protein EV363DRAFT_1177585 [Boletus edulis]|uniref:Uncharacterized protein n=1 Tax=Boletus edulis BED1 TaxID=1328754 RepID=A0AAD4BF14_BOLED|nr:hypothetical protein EV363DRAFT_1177585 [Boletus edulis]KAF8423761.1 hypothetical protein L210DRAFT_976855 [Boletus edulis BED1]